MPPISFSQDVPSPPDRPPAPQTIAIIGGGCSGILVAIHLIQNATQPLRLYLIDVQARLGVGVAYRTQQPWHLLNVPAGKMSAFPDQPDHFWDWIHAQHPTDPSVTPTSFVPRHRYGQYLQSLFQQATAAAPDWVQVEPIQAEAIALTLYPQQVSIQFADGGSRTADRVVLACGNLPPTYPRMANQQAGQSFYQSNRYIHNPWSPSNPLQSEPLSKQGAEPLSAQRVDLTDQDAIVLLGTGLTAIDMVITLSHRGHRGPIHLLSRHGLLPQTHRLETSPASVPPLSLFHSPPTCRDLLHQVRQAVAIAAQQSIDWRVVLDALRPQTQTLWQSLSLKERRRFLRHVRPYWDSHRHRLAPAIAHCIDALRQTGQLSIHAGFLHSCHDQPDGATVCFRKRGHRELTSLKAALVLNCTGSTADYRQITQPLMAQLLQQGYACADALMGGWVTAPNGALVNADGISSTQLYTLGPTRKGSLWETTAVPEIRKQAQQLAIELLQPRA